MTKKLDENHVRDICNRKNFTLIRYKNSRNKVQIKCNSCQRKDSLWWSSIRDGNGCAWCTGQKIDLNKAFFDKNLVPNTSPNHCREKVFWKCKICHESGPNPISEKDLKRRESTPCWICNTYQINKRKMFFHKGWELFEPYEKRKRYKCACKVCGHKYQISANTVEKWSANCPVCRDIRLYKLLGNRLEKLNAIVTGPINLKNLVCKSDAICLTCSKPSKYVFKDIVYSRQGFCKSCARVNSSEKRRVNNVDEILKSKNLIFTKGIYKNEHSIISYKCEICKKEDKVSVAALRIRKTNCLFCDGRKLKDDPLQIFKDKGLVPQESFKGHQTPLLCLCSKCGNNTGSPPPHVTDT